MNNNIIQDLLRMRELFGLTEQSSPFSVVEMLKSNDPVKIKEFLTEKSDLQNETRVIPDTLQDADYKKELENRSFESPDKK